MALDRLFGSGPSRLFSVFNEAQAVAQIPSARGCIACKGQSSGRAEFRKGKKLNLEHLAVESFETAALEAQVRGTVQAHGMVGTQAYNCAADYLCRQTCYGNACNYTVLCP